MPTIYEVASRAAYALQAGWSVASATYRQQDFSPFLETGWDTEDARLNRYAVYTAYDYNQIYSRLHALRAQIVQINKLYQGIRGIYNPVKRQKDILKSNIYKGSINRDDLTAGAMPLRFDNRAALTAPLLQIIKWSNFERALNRYSENAAIKGDAAFWIVDEPDRRRVRVEPISPSRIKEAEFDSAGNVKAAVIQYQYQEKPPIQERYKDRRMLAWYAIPYKTVTRTLVVDREWFTVYENEDQIDRWANDYPFVPLVIKPFAEGEGHWGVNAFYSALPKIDAVNDAASLLIDQVRKGVVTILKAKGIKKGKLQMETDPEKSPIIYLDDPDTDIEPLLSNLDIDGSRKVVEDMNRELESDMPELAFQRAIERNERLTAPGIRAAVSPAIGRIENARSSLDPGTAAALQMALTIGGIRGYDSFDQIDERTYDRGDMELSIAERPVIADEISALDKVKFYPSIAKLPTAYQVRALRDMGVPEPEIAKMTSGGEPEALPEGDSDESGDGTTIDAVFEEVLSLPE